MTLDEFIDEADRRRSEMPARPTREQWDRFFAELIELGPKGGALEAYYLERDTQFAEETNDQ